MLLRIVFALMMVVVIPFGPAFWACYLCGGFTDLIDGFIARKLNQQSLAGAKLDSITNMIFAVAIMVVILENISIPVWIWLWVSLIALIRIISYMIGFYKFRTFSSSHTYANKATGALIFAYPLLYPIWDMNIAGIIIGIVAFVSSLEELIITVKSRVLERDCKTIFLIK